MKITGALLIAALVACDVPDPFPDQAPADGGALDAAPTDSCSLGARDCQRWWPQQARDADLAPASISYNALGADPLMFNALLRNPRANVAITHHSLTSLLQENPAADSDAAYFQRQLRDPFARHVVDYLVGCALPETQSVFWTDPVTGTSLAWHGDLGLCPSWQTGSIHENQACTELLSACLLARNNARQEEVLISVHGARSVSNEALVALPLAPAAAGGEPCEAASFAPDCPLEGGAWGPTSNCPGPSNMSYPGRWRSRHIGACTADTPVTLEVTPTACADDLLIRICDGVYGCDFDAAEHRESTAIPCDATSAITFTCASEETFTVMYANADPMQPAS
ncbi:MAG TPA: hypothetical protein VNM90_13980, partial [Haliangium sp.]|nr:hypothetical protein [Haliangium sp.]